MAKNGAMTINIKSLLIALGFLTIGLIVGWLLNSAIASDGSSESRKVTVDGTAEVSAVPDENLFYASYEEKNADQIAAKDAAVSKAEQVVAELENLGVESSQITNDIGTYEDYDYDCVGCNNPVGYVAYNNLQIKINDADLAEKVYNYLLTTDATGQVTPNSNFSTDKEKQLKVDARKLAVEDAKNQAQQLADELEADLGKVISVEEKQGFDIYYGGIYDDVATQEARIDGPVEPAQLLTGERELNFTVEVVFELK